jgi:hypothetical protein
MGNAWATSSRWPPPPEVAAAALARLARSEHECDDAGDQAPPRGRACSPAHAWGEITGSGS